MPYSSEQILTDGGRQIDVTLARIDGLRTAAPALDNESSSRSPHIVASNDAGKSFEAVASVCAKVEAHDRAEAVWIAR